MVKKHHTKRFISTFFTTALLTACTAAPIGQIEDDLAQIPIPAQWMHAHHDAQSQAADHWWHNFQDPDLNRLIDQALNHNHILANSYLLLFFDNNHPNRYEVISHCGFDLHFPDDE